MLVSSILLMLLRLLPTFIVKGNAKLHVEVIENKGVFFFYSSLQPPKFNLQTPWESMDSRLKLLQSGIGSADLLQHNKVITIFRVIFGEGGLMVRHVESLRILREREKEKGEERKRERERSRAAVNR